MKIILPFGAFFDNTANCLKQRSHPRAKTRFFPCCLPPWLFFQLVWNLFFPIFKRAFSYNTVFISFFEEKSNVFLLGYRLAEKTGVEALWRREEKWRRNLISITSVVAGVEKLGATGGRRRGGGGGGHPPPPPPPPPPPQQLKSQSKDSLLLVDS